MEFILMSAKCGTSTTVNIQLNAYIQAYEMSERIIVFDIKKWGIRA